MTSVPLPIMLAACAIVLTPAAHAGLRSKPYGSYVIFYSALKTVVRIERILHGARDIGGVLST